MTQVQIVRSFATEAGADSFIAGYLQNYAREGYGTFLTKTATHDGSWIVSGSRQSSCD